MIAETKTFDAPAALTPVGVASFLRPARIVKCWDDAFFEVELETPDGVRRQNAYLAMAGAGRFSPGARVLVAGESAALCYVIGVLDHPLTEGRAEAVDIPGASAVAVDDRAIEVRDSAGALVFSYAPSENRMTLRAPEGDLVLDAPNGDIMMAAGGDVRVKGGTACGLSAPNISVTAKEANVAIQTATYDGLALTARVHAAKLLFNRLETTAKRTVSRVGRAFSTISEAAHINAERMTVRVRDAWNVRSKRTNMKSVKETVIDGERINLG
ncbi:MAG: DUF3540 domain-containing protein [Pseudomonadota bacterium]